MERARFGEQGVDLVERIAVPGASVVIVQCGADVFREDSGSAISAGLSFVLRV